jgi:hypothetical protein
MGKHWFALLAAGCVSASVRKPEHLVATRRFQQTEDSECDGPPRIGPVLRLGIEQHGAGRLQLLQ